MSVRNLTRRFVLLMPLAVAACSGEEQQVYEPLRYNDLPPIQLNVASIDIQQRFIPAGIPPDVSNQDPDPPIQALRAMANDRLQAFGTSNKAVFAILDASLIRQNDVITGSMTVSLAIQDDGGAQLGFAEARVQRTRTGPIDNLRAVLYDMTKALMNDMNVEFEYQIRRNLKNWLVAAVAPDTPVEQAPLDQSGPDQSAPQQALPEQGQPVVGQPAPGQPAPGQSQLGNPLPQPSMGQPAGQLQPGQPLQGQPLPQ